MGYVFISYSSKNIEAALGVKNVLIKNGIECWMAPECIEAGMNYTTAIPAAIEGCYAFVLVLSGEAQLSQWVTKELDLALNRNRTIVPFHLDSSSMTDQYDFMLAGCQRIEAYSRTSSAYAELIDRLSRLDPNDSYNRPSGDTYSNAGVETVDAGSPRHDAELEHVVKTISADKTARAKKKTPKWVPVVISIVAVVSCAVIAGIIIAVVNITKAAKAAADHAQEAAQQFKDNITDSFSGEGGINLDVNPNGGVSISIGGKDNIKDNDDDDDDKDNSVQIPSQDQINDLLGGLLGDDLSSALGLINDPSTILGGNNELPDPTQMGCTDVTTMEMTMWNASVVDYCMSVNGNEYSKSLLIEAPSEDAGFMVLLPEGHEYTMLTGVLACPITLKSEVNGWKVRVYIDSSLVEEYEISSRSQPQIVSLPVSGASTVSFELEGTDHETGAIFTSAYMM